MSPVRIAPAPKVALYRVGHLPDPYAWTPWRYAGDSRFDDPLNQFRTMYLSETRKACFVEVLHRFRPSLRALARLREVEPGIDETVPPPLIPATWYERRAVVRVRLEEQGRYLDLRELETVQELRGEFARLALRLGIADIDLATVRGSERQLTQGIARWAYEGGCSGIAYRSRFGDQFECWAVFEGVSFEPPGSPEPITGNDPDLLAAAGVLGLTVAR